MSEEGPNTGGSLIGIFVMLFGLCLALTGGGCTIFILGQNTYAGLGLLLLVALALLALGLWLMWIGFKLLSGRYRK